MGAALLLATGLKVTQWTLLGGIFPLNGWYWTADWTVTALLAFALVQWLFRFGHARRGRVALTAVAAVMLAQLPMFVWKPLSLSTAGMAAALTLAGIGGFLAGLHGRRPRGAGRLALIGGSATMVTLVSEGLLTLTLHDVAGTEVDVSVKAFALLGTLGLMLREIPAGRARQLQRQVQDHEATLQLERDLHATTIMSLNDRVVVCDGSGQIVAQNEQAALLHRTSLIGSLPADWVRTYGVHTPDFTRYLELSEVPLYRGLQGQQVRNSLIGIDNGEERRIVTCNANPIRNPAGDVVGAVVAYNDVTERELARQELERTATRHAAIIDALDEGLLMVDLDGVILSGNGRVRDLLGLPVEPGQHYGDALGACLIRRPDGAPWQPREPDLRRLLTEPQAVRDTTILEFVRPDGTSRWIRLHVQGITQDQVLTAALFTFVDITAETQLDVELSRVTRYAPLTGLPNRDHFVHLTRALPDGPGRTLLVLRSDNLSQVCVSQPQWAERILIRAARTVQACFADALLFGQLDDHTFAALLPHEPAELHRDLRQPVTLDGQQVYLRWRAASRGLGVDTDIRQALEDAQGILDVTPPGTLLPFEARHLETLRRRLLLDSRLQLALAEQAFTVHYQPIVNLRTGRLEKAEALVRWHDQELGMVPPDEFIPLAEQQGQIPRITDVVVWSALREARRASAALGRPFRIAVNVSPSELNAPDFLSRVEHLMLYDPEAAHLLAFEVTESGVLENLEAACEKLQQVRDWGFRLALDDFGTGHSALSVLQHLPIHHLKLDRSFVWGIGSSPRQRVITAAIVQLARELQFEVICEGIETREHEAILRSMNCALGQGYLYSRPIPAPDWAALERATLPDPLARRPG